MDLDIVYPKHDHRIINYNNFFEFPSGKLVNQILPGITSVYDLYLGQSRDRSKGLSEDPNITKGLNHGFAYGVQ